MDEVQRWTRIRDSARKAGETADVAKAEAMLAELQKSATPTQAPTPGPIADPLDATRTRTAAPTEDEPPTPGLWERFQDQLGSELHSVGAGLGLVEPDDEDQKRFEKSEIATANALNAYTMGAGNAVLDRALPGLPQVRRNLQSNPTNDTRAAALGGSLAGTLGSALAGPAKLVDKLVTGAASKLPTAIARRAAGSVLGQGAVGATSAATQNAIQNVAETGDVTRAFDNVGLPLFLGAAGPYAAWASKEARNLLRGTDDPTWIGRYRDFVESGRSYHPPTSEANPLPPRRAEIEEVAPGHPEAMRDVQDASDTALKRFVVTNNRLTREGQGTLAEARRPHLDTSMSRRRLVEDIKGRREKNMGRDGLPKDRSLDKSLEQLRSEQGGWLRRGEAGKWEGVPDPSYEDLIARRAAEREASQFGEAAPTPEARRARVNYDVYGQAIKNEPALPQSVKDAEANAAASATRRRRERDIVFRTEDEVARNRSVDRPAARPADPDDMVELDQLPENDIDTQLKALSASARRDMLKNAQKGGNDLEVNKELAGSTFFSRAGDDNVPGKRVRELHEQLAAADPEYARIRQFVEDVKAREATGPHLLSQVPSSLGPIASLWGATPIVQQQMRLVGGRLLDPGMQLAEPALRRSARLVPLLHDPLDAYRERRRREETP